MLDPAILENARGELGPEVALAQRQGRSDVPGVDEVQVLLNRRVSRRRYRRIARWCDKCLRVIGALHRQTGQIVDPGATRL